ncbi:MAG: tRNA dihydrouridine synthase DusB, partial [Spirochaetaceae bacterium]|nr:tRNA dihydrouridine synthase DusB [Spirochaetaceae bacterium]
MSLYRPVRISNLHISGNLFLAPVAGYSDRAFRTICRDCGADFSYTEMVSAEALVRGSGKTGDLMLRADNEDIYGVQLFGGEPEVMAQGAVLCAEKALPSVIDVNAGCPVSKIVKTGAGAALTKAPARLGDVVRAMTRALSAAGLGDLPVTVKIRAGWDAARLSWREAALAAVEAGARAVTLHGRTRAQGYGGGADWGILGALVEMLAARDVPVFGSGDVFTPEDAQRMLGETGCAAVFFARGALGNPCIFLHTRDLLTTGAYRQESGEERLALGLRELELLAAQTGERHACLEMRK